MKIFLQHTRSRAFLTVEDSWSTDPSAARLFATSQELWSHCAKHRFLNAQMLVKFDDPRFDMIIPVVFAEPTPPRTILLVDDSPDDILLMRRALKKAGIQDSIQVVTDGSQAVAYLSGEHGYSDRALFPLPHLIVMDIKMPRMNGLEVLQWMNTRETFREIPKIILSSSQLDSDIADAYGLGANTYFTKPNGFEELLVLVKSFQNYGSPKGSSALPNAQSPLSPIQQ